MPQTSIVVRTLNEEKHLGNLLRAIEEQEYKDWEIIVVDSGSTDGTLDIARRHKVKLIEIPSRDFTFGYALNVGCKAARGNYLVFASAHVLPMHARWLGSLVAPFADERVAMVYGRQKGDREAKFSERMDLHRLFGTKPFNSERPVDYANNANAAVRRALWEETPFDEYLFGLEDIAWAREMTARGLLVHYAPEAAVYHIHREAWHQVFNRYRREAIAAVRLNLPHPPQSRVDFLWPLVSLLRDLVASFPNWRPSRVEEILRFRYYQWKGGRQGWFHDRALDLERDKYGIFYPANKAVVIRAPKEAALEERSLPPLKPGDIVIRVAYVGICKTDLEVLEGTLGYYKDGVARYPIVPGHEFSGTIVQVGANNKYRERFKVDERVVGECILSRHRVRQEVGVVNHDGAYAELVVVPGDHVHNKLPEALDLKTAALAEPLAVVLRALRRFRPRLTAGASVAILGAGPIGNLCAQVLAREGYEVSIFDRNEGRLALLRNIAHVSSDIEKLEAYDAIIEATGSKDVLVRALKESRVGAPLLLLGFPYGDMQYNFEQVVGGDREIVGSVGADRTDFQESLKLLAHLDTAAFTKTVLPLWDYEKAWELLREGKHFKILLRPGAQ